MSKDGPVDDSRILSTGEDGLILLNFVDLKGYGHFHDPVEREKFLASDIGKAQIELIKEEVKTVMGIEGELTSDQISNMLLVAQSMQGSGFMKPSLEATIDPSTGKVLFDSIIYSESGYEPVPESQSQEQVVDLHRLEESYEDKLYGIVDVHDPEAMGSIKKLSENRVNFLEGAI